MHFIIEKTFELQFSSCRNYLKQSGKKFPSFLTSFWWKTCALYETRYSRIDQTKFVEDRFLKIFKRCGLFKNITDLFFRSPTSRGGRGQGLPCSFLKIRKRWKKSVKNALITFIYGINFSFEICFKNILEKNLRDIPLQGLPFMWFNWNVCWSSLIARNLLCPLQKTLVGFLLDLKLRLFLTI